MVFLGLLEYMQNPTIHNIIRMLQALPLLPAHQMLEGLAQIELRALVLGFLELLQPMFEYVRDQWMVRVGVEVLSVFGLAHKINNAMESNHRSGF